MLEQELWNLVATVGNSLAPGQTTAAVDARLTDGLRAMRATSTYRTAGFPATGITATVEVGDERGRVIGTFPGFI